MCQIERDEYTLYGVQSLIEAAVHDLTQLEHVYNKIVKLYRTRYSKMRLTCSYRLFIVKLSDNYSDAEIPAKIWKALNKC